MGMGVGEFTNVCVCVFVNNSSKLISGCVRACTSVSLFASCFISFLQSFAKSKSLQHAKDINV